METNESFSLTKEERAYIRSIANEDKTPFAVAAMGVEELNKLLRQEEIKHKKYDLPFDREDIKKRILRSRKTFSSNLLETVRNWNAEEPEKIVDSTRKCRYAGCNERTMVSSYYWCEEHFKPVGVED